MKDRKGSQSKSSNPPSAPTRGGRRGSSTGRSDKRGGRGEGRVSKERSQEKPKAPKPKREAMIDPRHTRGAARVVRKRTEEKPERSERSERSERRESTASQFRDRDRSRDSRYSRTGKIKKEESVYNPNRDEKAVRLNKFLSNAGIASRREADRLIELGLVSVNGKVITELGFKVDPEKDLVKYDDVALRPERYRYVLLNKPKDYVTTTDDPDGRKTVMFLIKDACKERIYPVGRLDRNTTGLLLFTNDGELAKRLTNPKKGLQRLYHVETVEKVQPRHLDELRAGITLEEGPVKVEEVSYVNDDPRQVGIRINSGKNSLVRDMLEHFNYTIKKLDRVMIAGLTKKDLPRGRYRHLSEQEVNFLKMVR